jgi:predicted lactoylglutathione lyase
MFVPDSGFVVLYSNDIESTKLFYNQIGGEVIESDDTKLVVALGNLELHFVLSSTEKFENYQFITKQPVGQGIILYIGVENLEDTKSFVETAGSPTIFPIQANHWGTEEFLFEDPNGFKIVVYRVV